MGPSGELNPPDGGSDEGNIDKPIGHHRELDNVMVRDLLHLLGPILMECQEPLPTAAPVTIKAVHES